MDERQLVERCRRHDGKAQRELYRSYVARLRAVCLRYVSVSEDAEDLLQDAFVKIFSAMDTFRYRGEGSLWGWMKQITVNLAVDSLRRQDRFRLIPLDEGVMDREEPDAEEVALLSEEVLLRLVGELPTGYRTVFNLCCIEGLSHREAARLMGIAEHSSSSQLSRARSLLAQKINDYLEAGPMNSPLEMTE